jgi:hypothetical protein
MGDGNTTLLTVVIVVIAIIVVLWLLWNLNKDSVRVGPRPEPVGGVKSENIGPGEVKISWHRALNAAKYRVFINNDPIVTSSLGGKGRIVGATRPFVKAGPKVGCGQDCCPGTCDACVTQSNYQYLVETNHTEVIVESCDAQFCYIVVAYNEFGQSGECTTIFTATPQCACENVDAWVVTSNCLGTTIKWRKPKCCLHFLIYVNGTLVDTVDASLETVTIPSVPSTDVITVACEGLCNTGPQITIQPTPHHEDHHEEHCGCDDDHHEEHHDDHTCHGPNVTGVPGFKSRPRSRPAPRMPSPNKRSDKPRISVVVPKTQRVALPKQ